MSKRTGMRILALEQAVAELQRWESFQRHIIEHPIQPAEQDDELDEDGVPYKKQAEDKCKSCKFYAPPAGCNCENYSAYQPKEVGLTTGTSPATKEDLEKYCQPKVCQTCGGLGEVGTGEFCSDGIDNRRLESYKPCPDCGGKTK